MNKWILGGGLVAAGLALVVLGLASRPNSDGPTEISDAAPLPSSTSTTFAVASTTLSPVTTTSSSTTTTLLPTTTTTTPPPSVAEFIVEYAAATEANDVGFLFDRLFPPLIDVFGPELCRGFVEREIIVISDYILIGEVAGPFTRTLNVGSTAIAVDQYFEAPVRFTFEGQSFDLTATFVALDGEVYWIGECR